MKVSAIIKLLQKAGVTGDALVAAFEESEADARRTRSAGAERTARWRKKKEEEEAIRASHVTSQASQASHVTEREILLTDLPSSNSSKKEEVVGVARARGPKRKPKTLLPDHWAPEIDMSSPDAPEMWRQVDRMRNWAKGDGVLKADWNATWRNWWDRRHDFGGNQRGKNQSGNGFKDALGRLGEAVEWAERGLPEGGAQIVRLLPDGRR